MIVYAIISYFSSCFQNASSMGWYFNFPGLYSAPDTPLVAGSFADFVLVKKLCIPADFFGCGDSFSVFIFSFLSSLSFLLDFVFSSFTSILLVTATAFFSEAVLDFGVVFFSTLIFFAEFAFGVLVLDFAGALVCFFVFGVSFSPFSNLIGLVTNSSSSFSTLPSLTGVRGGDFVAGFSGELKIFLLEDGGWKFCYVKEEDQNKPFLNSHRIIFLVTANNSPTFFLSFCIRR